MSKHNQTCDECTSTEDGYIYLCKKHAITDDLLEAFKDSVGCICGYGVGHPLGIEHSDECQNILNIIAKAEGEQC